MLISDLRECLKSPRLLELRPDLPKSIVKGGARIELLVCLHKRYSKGDRVFDTNEKTFQTSY